MRTVATYRRHALAAVVLGAFAMLAACRGDTPTTPSSRLSHFSGVRVQCAAAGANLQCSATVLYGGPQGYDQPVTTEGRWTTSDPHIAVVTQEGIVTVLGSGEIDIIFAYSVTSGSVPTSASVAYVVDPSHPPRLLYFLGGLIREDDGTDTRIPGAVVEIIAGTYNAGKRSAPSNQFGAYRIDHILIKEAFTVRASKDGYESVVTTYRVDGPVQLPGETNSRPFLDFRLRRRS